MWVGVAFLFSRFDGLLSRRPFRLVLDRPLLRDEERRLSLRLLSRLSSRVLLLVRLDLLDLWRRSLLLRSLLCLEAELLWKLLPVGAVCGAVLCWSSVPWCSAASLGSSCRSEPACWS